METAESVLPVRDRRSGRAKASSTSVRTRASEAALRSELLARRAAITACYATYSSAIVSDLVEDRDPLVGLVRVIVNGGTTMITFQWVIR